MAGSFGLPSDSGALEGYARAQGAKNFVADVIDYVSSNINFMMGGGAALAAGFGGGDVSAGAYWNPFAEEGGFFASAGTAAGVNLGFDGFFGFAFGAPAILSGQAITQSFAFGPFTLTTMHQIDGLEFYGATLGVGTGVFNWGYSAAVTTTICTTCGPGKSFNSQWSGSY